MQTVRSITISTRAYELSHGRKPKGRGSWAFFFDGMTDINDAKWFQGTYTEGLKLARAWAFTKGHHTIEVGS